MSLFVSILLGFCRVSLKVLVHHELTMLIVRHRSYLNVAFLSTEYILQLLVDEVSLSHPGDPNWQQY